MISNLYNNLYIYWKDNGYKYYNNQNLYLAGQEECEEIFIDESLDIDLKNEFAKGLLELFIDSLNNNYELNNLIKYLEEFPIIQYYFVLIDKLNILLKEEVISEKAVHEIAIDFITKHEEKYIVKFGLTLLKAVKEEKDLEIFKVFSNDNEFIFYAIEGIKEFSRCNSIIFNIAKGAKGYGRVIAISSLEPFTVQIKEWFIEEASKNNILESTIAIMTFNEYDFLDYFFDSRITKKKYDILIRNLKLIYESKEFFNNRITINIIEGYYFQYFTKFTNKFDSIYIMAVLLGLFSKIDNEDKINVTLDLCHNDVEILEYIKEEFLKEDYKKIILDALKDNNTNKEEVINLSFVLGYDLTFENLKVVLDKSPLDYSVCSYIMINNDIEDKRKLIEHVNKYIDYETVAQEPKLISENDIDKQTLHDKILYLIIYFMGELREDYIEINIKSLSARYIPTRQAAFNNLKYLDLDIIKEYIKCIQCAYIREVDLSLKAGMERFLNNIEKKDKIRRYEYFEKVKPYVNDIFLAKTYIDDNKHLDLTIIEDKLKEGNYIYLKRENRNIYDKNAIMVLTDNGYLIGYISKGENKILKNLNDGGKVIYGKITSVNNDYTKIEISLFLSSIDIIKQVSDAFNMISELPIGYIN